MKTHTKNENGISVRCIAIRQGRKTAEFFYQKVGGQWVKYKRVVRVIH